MSNEDPGLGLAAAIKLVRSELQQAMEDGQSSPLAFTAGPVQLEFEVAFGKGKEGGGVSRPGSYRSISGATNPPPTRTG